MPTTIGSGLGSSIGFGSETTWGTFATPTRWVEFESESIEWKPKRMRGKGLGAGNQVQRNATEQQTTSTVEGDIKTPFYYKSMGLLLGNMMGSQGTGPVQQGATAAYLQTHALATSFGQSLTIQKGVPDQSTGTIHQYNFTGCKIEQAVFECGVDEYLMGSFTIDGRGYDTTNAYTSATYQSGNGIFAFNQGYVCMGALGSEVVIEGTRKFTLTLKRPLRKDNFYLDGTGLKSQQVQNGFFEITVDLETDYLTDSQYAALMAADTAQSINVYFVGPQIAAGTGGAKTITAITSTANGAVVTSTAHGFSNGQQVTIAGVTGTGTGSPNNATLGNPSAWVIDSVATNTFRIPWNSAAFTYTSGGTATQNYQNLVGFQIPNLRWNSELPKIGGPDIIQPKMQLVGLYDDTHTAATLLYQSTDTTL